MVWQDGQRHIDRNGKAKTLTDGEFRAGLNVPLLQGDDVYRRARELRSREPLDLSIDDLGRLIQSLEEEMHEAATELRFEYAARLRDEINELKRELRDLSAAGG